MNLNIECKLKCDNRDKYAEMFIFPDVNGGVTFTVITESKQQYDFTLSCNQLDYVKKFASITRCHESACNKHGIWKEGGEDEAI